MKQLYRLCLMMAVLAMGLGGEETAVFAKANHFTGFQWVITVTIDQGEPTFLWNVFVWEFNNIGAILQRPLDCDIDPSVVIHNDHLTFNGNGGIYCRIPSFAADVAQLTNGKVHLPPYTAPDILYVEADVTLPAPTFTTQAMSLFSHPDFRYDTVVYSPLDANGAGALGSGEQRIVGGTTLMTISQISTQPTATTLRIDKHGSQDYVHTQDGAVINGFTVGDKFLVGTGAATICIGCGPTGYFIGDLWYGEFDPGCTGICGI